MECRPLDGGLRALASLFERLVLLFAGRHGDGLWTFPETLLAAAVVRPLRPRVERDGPGQGRHAGGVLSLLGVHHRTKP